MQSKVSSHVSSKLFQDAPILGRLGEARVTAAAAAAWAATAARAAAEERPQKRGECLRRGKKKREEESRGYAKGKLSPQGAKGLVITLSTQASGGISGAAARL